MVALEEEEEDEEMAPVEEEAPPPFDPFALDGAQMEDEADTSRMGAGGSSEEAPQAAAEEPRDEAAQSEYIARLRDELDQASSSWDASGSSEAQQRAQELWHKLSELTSELSASLTESLRMIL